MKTLIVKNENAVIALKTKKVLPWELSKTFFQSHNITFDCYVLDTKGVEMYMREDDHISENGTPHFFYKNSEGETSINYVCGTVVFIGDRKSINQLLTESEKLRIKYLEIYKEVIK